jgi:hypothetical protein
LESDRKSGRPGMMLASTSGLRSRLRSVLATFPAASRSCLGLCLLQGCRAQICASGRDRPRPDHQPPGLCNRLAAGRGPLSAHGLWASFPADVTIARAARRSHAACGDAAPPSPALQRLDGADAWPIRAVEAAWPDSPEWAPCLRFCTFRERDEVHPKSTARCSADLNLFNRKHSDVRDGWPDKN